MSEPSDMKNYYDRRATEYEKVHEKPERTNDLAKLKREVKKRLKGERVLEIACGTGYWTGVFASAAEFVLATDQSAESLDIAKGKGLDLEKVRFSQDDAYALDTVEAGSDFTAGFAGFWWSHVPRSRLREFLANLHARLQPGAKVIFLDNAFVAGSNTQISHADDEGNTYQTRRLADGTTHEVLKNFPTDEELRRVLSEFATDIQIVRLNYYWLVEYRLP